MKQAIKKMKEELGWQGMLGITLLLLAAAFVPLFLDPLERQTALMRDQLEAVRSKSTSGSKTFGAGNSQQELAAFFDSFPEEKDVTDTLALIHAIASAMGVEIRQVDYSLDGKDWPRVEYGMNFPMTGEYTRIRAFLSSVLAKNPAVALDHVNFQRDRIGDLNVKANVRMTLFLRPSR